MKQRNPPADADGRRGGPMPSPARVFDLVDEIAIPPRAMAIFDRDLQSARRRLVRLNATVKPKPVPERGPR